MKDPLPKRPVYEGDYTDSVVETILYGYDNEYSMKDMYAFTLNPDPGRYKSADPYDQYKSLLNCCFGKRGLCHTFSRFLFVPELTVNGNVHVHGWYIVKDKVKYHRWFLPMVKQWGFTVIKDRVDSYWLYNYLVKTLDTMEQIMENLPVPLTDTNIRDYINDCKAKYTMSKKMPNKIKQYDLLKYFK